MFITAQACHIPDVMKCLRFQALCGGANYRLGVRTNCYLALSFLVANSNSSFYSFWSLSHSVTESVCHVTLECAHVPV